jgi:hypothetical protein
LAAESDQHVIAAALAAYAGYKIADILQLHNEAMASGDGVIASQSCEPAEAIATVERRLKMAPLDESVKINHLERLTPLLTTRSQMTTVEATAWQAVARGLMPAVAVLNQPVIQLSGIPKPQEIAWGAVLDLDENLTAPWVLIGGQMVALWCAEANIDLIRPTEDADVVLDVWLRRGALDDATRLLRDRGFSETETSDGYGYRYRCDDACVDLMVPDHIERQNRQPTTATGRVGLPAAGGNQALIRAERVQVKIGDRVGYVRRPNILGALVAKAAAAVTDTRDTDRHRDDLAVLGRIALNRSAYRAMHASTTVHDRQRLRRALGDMPSSHRAWQRIPEPELVRLALQRLARDSGIDI